MSEENQRVERSGVTVECVQGNIVKQPDVDAVVNAANAQLRIGGGVAGAIHRAAGPELDEECRPLAPIRPGEAVITGAGELPNQHVIHTLGPVYGRDTPSDKLLAECYRNSLARAEENGLASIAFPAISTGAFGYPMEEAAGVAMRTVAQEAERPSSVTLVRFVLFDGASLEVHLHAMRRVFGEG
jgi:O-acetyl-ADP-ribose deacetylase